MTIAVIAALYLGQYPEAAVVIVLYVLGERLEDIGLENSKSALDQLIQSVPKTAFPELVAVIFELGAVPTATFSSTATGVV